MAPDFSFPRCLLLSSSFRFVGEGALLDEKKFTLKHLIVIISKIRWSLYNLILITCKREINCKEGLENTFFA